jgi:hypothetical protein
MDLNLVCFLIKKLIIAHRVTISGLRLRRIYQFQIFLFRTVLPVEEKSREIQMLTGRTFNLMNLCRAPQPETEKSCRIYSIRSVDTVARWRNFP